MAAPQNYVSISRRAPDVEDYIDMLRRYRSWIVGPMFAGLVISVVVAFLWPDTYISQAMMRITPQQVSERLLPAVISTQMADRIGQMETEILSRGSLAQIIQKPSLNLYERRRLREPMEDIVQDMRNKYIKIQVLADPTGQSNGERRYASAFMIQFSYSDRYKAQAVVNELVARFLDQNVNVQRNKAVLTENFLDDEQRGAKEKLDKLEAAITHFRVENQGKLPEQLQSNMSAVTNVQMQLSALEDALGRDQQDKLILETRLQTIRNSQNFVAANLEDTVIGQAVKDQRLIDLNNRIAEAKSQLAGLLQIYRPDYPDIKQVQARISSLERERDDTEKQQAESGAVPAKKVVNPQMQKSLEDLKNEQAQVQAQIAARQAEIEAKTLRHADLTKSVSNYQSRIEGSATNQQQYEGLMRDYQLAKTQYEEMSQRQEASATARNLEEHKAGENLEVLDPASLPEQPSEPNRWAIAGIGTMIGLLAGILLAGAKEAKDTSLKNLKDVRAYTNLPVLSSVPLLENALLVRRKRRLFWLAWSSAIIAGTMAMSGSMYYYFFGRT
jgi:polysaccharide chain length determinant protein (PEP-CTERM system associated)